MSIEYVVTLLKNKKKQILEFWNFIFEYHNNKSNNLINAHSSKNFKKQKNIVTLDRDNLKIHKTINPNKFINSKKYKIKSKLKNKKVQ